MSTAHWLPLLPIAGVLALGAMSPGASFLLVVKLSVSRSRGAGIAAPRRWWSRARRPLDRACATLMGGLGVRLLLDRH